MGNKKTQQEKEINRPLISPFSKPIEFSTVSIPTLFNLFRCTIPLEIMMHIAHFFDPSTLASFFLVSKSMHNFARQETFWKMCLQAESGIDTCSHPQTNTDTPDKTLSYYQRYIFPFKLYWSPMAIKAQTPPEHGLEEEYEVRVVGSPNSGKTSCLLAALDPTSACSRVLPTRKMCSISMKLKSGLHGQVTQFHFHDIGGEGSLRTHSGYQCCMKLLFFDLGNKQDFETLVQLQNSLRGNTNDVVLIGTKKDLKRKGVSRYSVMKFVRSIDAYYMEVSAKEKENVDRLLNGIAEIAKPQFAIETLLEVG